MNLRVDLVTGFDVAFPKLYQTYDYYDSRILKTFGNMKDSLRHN